jgi:3-oxoadipate enol-lactonase
MPPASARQARMDLVLREGMPAVADAVIERWFTPGFRAAAPDRVGMIRRMLLATQPHGYATACSAIRDMGQRAHLRRIVAPTLIVCGSQDPATSVEHSQILAGLIRGSQLVMLEAAHLSNVERSDEFSAAMYDFLMRPDV